MRRGTLYVISVFLWACLPSLSALIPDADFQGEPGSYQSWGELGAEGSNGRAELLLDSVKKPERR